MSVSAGPDPRRLKVCLAASGGGHLRQLLDLEPAWGRYDAFFISEDTSLARSLAERWPTFFIEHVALGQGRLGAPLKMLTAGLRNAVQSARIVLRERPDVVISTGAGSVFFTLFWARVLGAKVIVIESFARFRKMSAFARLAGPFAHAKVLQSAALSKYWPGAPVFDPMRLLEGAPPAKESLVFATVGATLPFDRLVNIVATLKRQGLVHERVVAQTGFGGARPEGLECHETLSFNEMLSMLRKANIVICHGGTGSLITALREGCHVIAVPRRFERGEHYDDHQAEITEAFEERGLIQVADTVEELAAAVSAARSRAPILATSDPSALNGYLSNLLARWHRFG